MLSVRLILYLNYFYNNQSLGLNSIFYSYVKNEARNFNLGWLGEDQKSGFGQSAERNVQKKLKFLVTTVDVTNKEKK